MIGQRSGFTVLMQVWFGSGDEHVQNFHLGEVYRHKNCHIQYPICIYVNRLQI